MNTVDMIAVIAAVFLSPLLGGLVAGIDRKVTARLQGRYGPPILQPFYDVLKLFGKEKMVVNYWQIFCAYMYLAANILTVVLLALQSDLLLIFFVLAVGGVFLVIGALAAESPYSQIGAQRELIQMLTYEPLSRVCRHLSGNGKLQDFRDCLELSPAASYFFAPAVHRSGLCDCHQAAKITV
jgi:ech hydrogenase subunit B